MRNERIKDTSAGVLFSFLSQLLPHIKAGACLGGEFTMAVKGNTRVDVVKDGDEVAKGETLGRCASVLRRLAIGGETADVADAKGVGIVTCAMSASLVDGASGLYCAIQADDEVVADA